MTTVVTKGTLFIRKHNMNYQDVRMLWYVSVTFHFDQNRAVVYVEACDCAACVTASSAERRAEAREAALHWHFFTEPDIMGI